MVRGCPGRGRQQKPKLDTCETTSYGANRAVFDTRSKSVTNAATNNAATETLAQDLDNSSG